MKHLILIIACLSLSACGITKKHIETSAQEASLNAESTVKTDVKTDATKDTDKKSSTVITEKIDTNITIPENTVTAAKDLDELIRSGVLFAQDGPTSVMVTYDPNTKSIKAVGKTEAHNVPVTSTKTTEIDEAVKTTEETAISNNTQSNSTINQNEKQETELIDVKRNNVPGAMLSTLAIVLLIILVLFYVKERYFR